MMSKYIKIKYLVSKYGKPITQDSNGTVHKRLLMYMYMYMYIHVYKHMYMRITTFTVHVL